ncbi:hypothetical protein DIPPA_10015 [Diplonema papillatum]|nr:hypothetical protein DIPPA_10015 [Diplonema papillatum]
MEACDNGNETIVTELLSCGADASAADMLGDRALVYARRHGHAGVVKQLLSVWAAQGRKRKEREPEDPAETAAPAKADILQRVVEGRW